MRAKSLLKKVLLLSLVTTSVYALEHNVTLEEAIDIALKNNNKIKTSQTDIMIADTMYNQALSANYPTLDLEITAARLDEAPTFEMRGNAQMSDQFAQEQLLANAQFMDAAFAAQALAQTATPTANAMIAGGLVKGQTMPIEMEVQMAGRDTVFSQVNMKLLLYTGGKISAIVKQASIAKDIAQQRKRRTKSEVIYDVKRYYYGVVLTKQLKQLSDDTIARMGFIRDLTSELYKGGSLNVKKTDYLRSKLSVSLIESLHEEIVQKEAMAKSALLFAMGLSWKDKIDVSQESIKAPNMDATLEVLVNDAHHYNPDYTSLKLAIDIHGAKVDEAHSEYLPNIGLVASAQNIYSDYEYGLVNDTNKNSWTIGVGVQWSLFNGMRTTNKVEQSRLEKLRLEQQELLLQDGLALQVKQAFLKINSSYKQYNILKEAHKTSQENRDLNTRAYQEDMVETKDVIESQLFESYTTAAYYRSSHDHALARASADFIVGKAVEDSIKE